MPLRSLAYPLNLFAHTLTLEYGRADYVHYGVYGDDLGNEQATAESNSIITAQQRLSDKLAQAVDGCQQILVVGDTLFSLAQQLAEQGKSQGLTQISFLGEQLSQKSIAAASPSSIKFIEPSDSNASSQSKTQIKYDAIVLQGSISYLEQLDLLSQMRQRLAPQGRLILASEFIDAERAQTIHQLASLSSFTQLSARLGFTLLNKEDLTSHAQHSVAAYLPLLEKHRTQLIDKLRFSEQQLAQQCQQLQSSAQQFQTGLRGFYLQQLSFQTELQTEYADAAYGDIASFDPQEVASVFQHSFNTDFDSELWRWKYRQGKSIVARVEAGKEVVAHYGGAPRDIVYFGKNAKAIQICDVMVLPEKRTTYGKNSLFFKTAATFLEREIGHNVEHLLGFGFPNQKAMNIALRLGLYEKTDDFCELLFPRENFVGRQCSQFLQALDLHQPSHRLEVDRLWADMRDSMVEAIIGLRNWQYLQYRYFDHPSKGYECFLLGDGGSEAAMAVVVVKPHEESYLVMDIVCAAADYKAVIEKLNILLAQRDNDFNCRLWITKGWIEALRLEGAVEKDLGIEIPCNTWNPGPSAAKLYGAWWLTAGDMDFT